MNAIRTLVVGLIAAAALVTGAAAASANTPWDSPTTVAPTNTPWD